MERRGKREPLGKEIEKKKAAAAKKAGTKKQFIDPGLLESAIDKIQAAELVSRRSVAPRSLPGQPKIKRGYNPNDLVRVSHPWFTEELGDRAPEFSGYMHYPELALEAVDKYIESYDGKRVLRDINDRLDKIKEPMTKEELRAFILKISFNRYLAENRR